jgi:hypothetical protein
MEWSTGWCHAAQRSAADGVVESAMDRDPAGVTAGQRSVVVSRCAADGVVDGAAGTAGRAADHAADGVS